MQIFGTAYTALWQNKGMSIEDQSQPDVPETTAQSSATATDADSAVRTKTDQAGKSKARHKPVNWTAWIIVLVVALVLMVGITFFVANVLPVWWANLIGNQVDKNLASGVLLGLFYGSAFTFFPLLLIWQIRRPRISWPWKLVLVVAAVLLAVPNLITLGIHLGTNAAAHNATRILGTEATWFGTWTAYGAVLGGLAFLALIWGVASYKRKDRQVRNLKTGDPKN